MPPSVGPPSIARGLAIATTNSARQILEGCQREEVQGAKMPFR